MEKDAGDTSITSPDAATSVLDAGLRDADQRDVDMRDADMRDVDMRDADQRDVDMRDAGTPPADADIPTGLTRGAHIDLSLSDFPFVLAAQEQELAARRFDAYVPANQTRRTVIFLHGGAGNKTQVANALGISNLNQDSLDAEATLWLLPQGETIMDGGVATWENRVMTSGANDELFLDALARFAKEILGSQQVVLAGHSNGGMMLHRMWCETDAPIDVFFSAAGPPSERYDADNGDLSCGGTKPFWAIVGNQDHVLQTKNNLYTDTWAIREQLVEQAPNAFLNGTLVNERRAHFTLRAPNRCPNQTPPQEPNIGERYLAWNACNGTVRFWWVRAQSDYRVIAAGGNHPIAKLEADGGFSIRLLLTEPFF